MFPSDIACALGLTPSVITHATNGLRERIVERIPDLRVTLQGRRSKD